MNNLCTLQLLSQLRDLFEQVTDQADIGHLEDRRISVLVNGRNHLTILHTSKVLDGTRNTGTQIQLRRNVLPCLTDLKTVIGKSTVNGSTGGTDSSTQRVRQWHDNTVKLLLRLQTTTTRDDTGGGAQVGTLRLGEFLANPFGLGGGVRVGAVNDFSGAALRLGPLEGGTSHSDHLGRVGRLDGKDSVSGVDWADESCAKTSIIQITQKKKKSINQLGPEDILSSLSIPVISEICCTSNKAATRGRRLFPKAE